MKGETLSLFEQPRKLSESQILLRASQLHKAIIFGSEGEQAYTFWSGIPVVRNVLQSELYDVWLSSRNEVSLRFRQYQEGVDERFGIRNPKPWRPEETVSVLQTDIIRQGEGWGMKIQCLTGEDLRIALVDYRKLNKGDASFLDDLPEKDRIDARERLRFRIEGRDRSLSIVLRDIEFLQRQRKK